MKLKCFSNEEQTTRRQVRSMQNLMCDAGSFAIPLKTLNHTSRRDWTHISHVGVKVPFQVPFSVAEIVIHMQGLHQTASLRQNKELASMSTTSQSPQWY